MSFFSSLISGGAGDLIKTVGDVVDEFHTSDEEKMSAELMKQRATQEYDLEVKKLGIKGRELDIQEDKLDVENTSSARDANRAIQESENASWLAKNTPYIIQIVTVTAMFALVPVLIAYGNEIPSGVKEIMYMVIGGIMTNSTTIYNFLFGSSHGSSKKDERIAKMKP